MLRNVVEHTLVNMLDPDAAAETPEEGAQISKELVRQNPELAEFLVPENQEMLEARLAGQPLTLNSLRTALQSLAAIGKLETQESLDAAQKEAERIVQEKLRPKPKPQPARDKETGRFAVSDAFRQEYNRMPAAEIKRRYFSDPEFKKKVDTLEGVSAPAPKVASEEVINLTADEWRSIPSHVAQRKMNNSPAFRAAVEKLIREGKI